MFLRLCSRGLRVCVGTAAVILRAGRQQFHGCGLATGIAAVEQQSIMGSLRPKCGRPLTCCGAILMRGRADSGPRACAGARARSVHDRADREVCGVREHAALAARTGRRLSCGLAAHVPGYCWLRGRADIQTSVPWFLNYLCISTVLRDNAVWPQTEP